ncbi:hypothetical protein SO802_023588 [Lithocarpus litseifolius]|uniref:MULE transposase domain-containing protein n=1 Tax=Lithocarpus litseifolius TaxID=425828 RepID=A0AAW2CC18_9ROSI
MGSECIVMNGFTMPEIDIILYHGGPLKNPNANKGLPFEGPGIRSYYTQIDRRLKTLDELKTIIMEELCANPAIHSIQITYRMPHEVLKNRINYKYMAIETDKHVKIMFDKLERIPEVSGIELYIQLEPRADDEIQQTATSLQVTVPDAHCEYSTHVDDDVDADDDVNANDDDDDDDDYDDDDDDDDDNDDDDYVDEPTAINGEDLVDRDDFEERIDRGDFGDFERDIDDDDTLDVLKPNLHGLWMVTVYVGPHTCIPTRVRNDGRMMTCNFIAADILQKLCEDHTTPVKYLRSMIESKYQGHKPSYYKVWDAKQKAIGKMFGNWEESYQRLQKLLMAYIDQDSTTQVFYRTKPTGEDDTVILHYVYWSFGPSIAGFKYCKPVISIDGTHLYGKYQGKLLVAMATDANNKVFPLDFAVVDCESGSSD